MKEIRAVLYKTDKNGNKIMDSIFEFIPSKTKDGKFCAFTTSIFNEFMEHLNKKESNEIQIQRTKY